MSADGSVYVVTATYNERENLAPLHHRLRDAVPGAHLVVVDDASPDGTRDAVDALSLDDSRVHLIARPGKFGYASAHQDGMRFALEQGAARIVTLDADLSHDPAAIPALLSALDDADVAIGSRYVPGGGFEGVGGGRRLLSRFASLYARTILGLPVRDCTSGFRAYRADMVGPAGLLEPGPRGYVFLTEALWRCRRAGASMVEVPIIYRVRAQGQSKMSARVILESAWRTLAVRFGGGGRR